MEILKNESMMPQLPCLSHKVSINIIRFLIKLLSCFIQAFLKPSQISFVIFITIAYMNQVSIPMFVSYAGMSVNASNLIVDLKRRQGVKNLKNSDNA